MATISLNVGGDVKVNPFQNFPVLSIDIVSYIGDDKLVIYQKDTVYLHGSEEHLRAFFTQGLAALPLPAPVDYSDDAEVEGSESSNSPIDWADVMAPV